MLSNENKSFTVNVITGIIGGISSWKTHAFSYSPFASLQGFLIGIAFFALSVFIIKLLIGPKNLQWIMKKGGGWYFWGFWFITWTILYNLFTPV